MAFNECSTAVGTESCAYLDDAIGFVRADTMINPPWAWSGPTVESTTVVKSFRSSGRKIIASPYTDASTDDGYT